MRRDENWLLNQHKQVMLTALESSDAEIEIKYVSASSNPNFDPTSPDFDPTSPDFNPANSRWKRHFEIYCDQDFSGKFYEWLHKKAPDIDFQNVTRNDDEGRLEVKPFEFDQIMKSLGEDSSVKLIEGSDVSYVDSLYYANYVFSFDYQRYKNKGLCSPSLRCALTLGVVVAIPALLVAAGFIAMPFVSIPVALAIALKFLIVPSLVYLAVLSYGIINDMLAVRENLVYFFAGHQYTQASILSSNRRNVVAVAWGIVATWMLALGFSIAIGAVVSAALGLSAAISLICPLPACGALIIGAAVPVLGYAFVFLARTLSRAHQYALAQQKEDKSSHYLAWFENGLNNYTQTQYRKENGLDAANFNKCLSNSDRNQMGYSLMGFGVRVLKILTATLAAVLTVQLGLAVTAHFVVGVKAAIVSAVSLKAVGIGIAALSTAFPIAGAAIVGGIVLAAIVYLAVGSFFKSGKKECNLNFRDRFIPLPTVRFSSNDAQTGANDPDSGSTSVHATA